MTKTEPKIMRSIALVVICRLCSSDSTFGHGGNRRDSIPPHRLGFPETENALIFLNTPLFGTSSTKLLNERLRYEK